MRKLIMLALSTCFLSSACQTTRTVVPLRPDLTNPERFVCEPAGERPHIPPEQVIDWSRVTTVPQAHAAHDAYVASIRSREGLITAYIVALEGKLFACSNNATWLREFYSRLPVPPPS